MLIFSIITMSKNQSIMSTLIKNIRTLFSTYVSAPGFKRGPEMMHLPCIDSAYLQTENGKITAFGPMAECPDRADQIIDATGRFVLPTWADSHTHIVFAGSRESEYIQRIQGATYEEIANAGGGILNSAKRLADTSEAELYDNAVMRLEEVMGLGTGAIEIKSGYGLSYESELKILRVIQKLKESYDLPIKSTFLGAHAIPTKYKDNRRAYIDEVIDKMLPEVADQNLADYIDVFCDEGFFTVDETAEIMDAGAKYGLKSKIHANELANSGGVQIGIAHDAVSVDHLEQIEQPEIDALLKSLTIPTVLPSVSFFLNIRYAPARQMIDAGLGLAIASDYNPGSSPSGNIPFLISLACNKMKMHPNEAINAATINGAHAMELGHQVGSITRGLDANFILTNRMPSMDFLPYAFGSSHISSVYIKGKVV